MGMYTEFIFSCTLTKDTPKVCVDALDMVINGEDKKKKYENPQTWEEEIYNRRFIEKTTPNDEIQKFIDKYDFYRLFRSSSYYFGGANPISRFYYDNIDNEYHISTRANLKNYSHQIQNFIEYIRPYVSYGSGPLNIFAYVQYEEDEFPTIYAEDGIHQMEE